MNSRTNVIKRYAFIRRGVVLTCLLAIVWLQIGQAAETFDTGNGADGMWRNAEHGCINALYPLLRNHGYVDGYKEYASLARKSGLPNSFADLEHFTSALGFQLNVFYLSPQRLTDIEVPCILHLEDDPSKGGAFVVLLQVRETEVVYLHGPSAIVVQDSRERFFRRLSEVAAIVVPAQSSKLSIMLGSGLGAIAVLVLNRRASRVNNH